VIRLLRAIVWLRWRLLLGSLLGGKRRDALEQLSRAFALIVPLLFAALTLGSVVAVGVLGFMGGRAIGRGPFEPDIIMFVVRLAMAVMMALIIFVALAAPAQTILARYSRLIILPIPRQVLHSIEVAANLADPWIGFVIPGMLLLAAGLAVTGLAWPALVAAVSALLMIAVLASLSALIGFLVGWLMRSRRRGEMFTLVFVLALSLVSFIPAAITSQLGERSRERRRAGERRDVSLEQFDASLPVWTHALPSELYGRAVLHAVEGRNGLAAIAVAGLSGEAVLLFLASAAVHRRLLDSLEGDARRRRGATSRATGGRVPFLSPHLSAIAITQFRSALRTVRGRLVVLMPGPLMAVLAMLFKTMPKEGPWTTAFASNGHVVLGAGIVFSIYALQPFTMNLFGSDRHGLARHFLSPVTDADLARGKLAGCALLFATTVAICLVAGIAVAPVGSPFLWLATLVAGAAAFALLSPAFVWLSALFPLASDLSKTGPGGNPHALPMFGGTLLTLVVAAPAVALLVAESMWIHRPIVTLALMTAWLGVAAVIATPLVRLASRAIGLRRENLMLVAGGR
jgi:hypothetical protein